MGKAAESRREYTQSCTLETGGRRKEGFRSARAGGTTMQTLTPFGAEVKKRLIDLQMTQEELARRVGTSPKYLNMILYGKRSGKKYIEGIREVLEMWRNS